MPQNKVKPYIAQSSELHGAMNPKGIINAKFLVLVKALQMGDDPANVQQALYDWLETTSRKMTPEQIDKTLEMGPEKAYQAIVQNIGGGINPEKMPVKAAETLKRTLAYIATQHIHRSGRRLSGEIGKLRKLKQTYRAESLVDNLLK